jgi:hypothetical protein
MTVRDSILRMAPAQVGEGRSQGLQIVEPLYHHGERPDELPTLLSQIGALKERPRWASLDNSGRESLLNMPAIDSTEILDQAEAAEIECEGSGITVVRRCLAERA